MRNKGSINGSIHPYLRTSFWMKIENWWWESDYVGPKTKKRYRSMVAEMVEKHRNAATL